MFYNWNYTINDKNGKVKYVHAHVYLCNSLFIKYKIEKELQELQTFCINKVKCRHFFFHLFRILLQWMYIDFDDYDKTVYQIEVAFNFFITKKIF